MNHPGIGKLIMLVMLLTCSRAALADLYSLTTIDDPSAVNGVLNFAIKDGGPSFEHLSPEDGFVETASIVTPTDDPRTIKDFVAFGINDIDRILESLHDATWRDIFHDGDGRGDTFARLTDPITGGGAAIVRINHHGEIVDFYDRAWAKGWLDPHDLPDAPEPNSAPFMAGCLVVLAIVFRRKLRKRGVSSVPIPKPRD